MGKEADRTVVTSADGMISVITSWKNKKTRMTRHMPYDTYPCVPASCKSSVPYKVKRRFGYAMKYECRVVGKKSGFG